VTRFFAVGTGRCGTKYLANLLQTNNVNDAYWEKEPFLEERLLAYWKGELNQGRTRDLIKDLKRTRNDVFFEANHALTFGMPLLLDVFLDARFVHLHRAPDPCITSHLRNSPSVNLESRWTADEKFTAACKWWSMKNGFILGLRERIEDELVLDLPFEDLVSGEVDALQDFLGMEFEHDETAAMNKTSQYRADNFPPPTEWSDEKWDTLEETCGEVAEALGYDV
jgi:hypothetical protein